MLFHIDIYDGNTVLLVPLGYYPEELDKFRGFPERKWHNNTSTGIKGWAIPVTEPNLEYLYKTWTKDQYSISAQAKVLINYQKMSVIVDGRKATLRWEYLFNNATPEFEYPSAIKPFDHQRVTVEAGFGAEAFGLLMEMGTGKTKCVIDESQLYGLGLKENEVLRICVMCPKSLIDNWEREFIKNYPDILDYKIVKLNKGDLKSIASMVELFTDLAPIKICIVSHDSVATQIKQLLMFSPTLLVIDESHYMKNPDTDRWKAIKKVSTSATMRRILTGTPISNNILDLWAQFELLRPGCLGYSTFSAYKHTYAEVDNWCGHETVIGYREDKINDLKERMAKVSFVVKKSQCLDLPAKMYTTVEVDMPYSMRVLYDKFATEFCCALDNGSIVATEHIIVQMLKLSQICSGFVTAIKALEEGVELDEDIKRQHVLEYIPGGDAKLDIMLDRAEDVMREGKIIIWSRFQLDNEVIHKRLIQRGYEGGRYDSTVNDRARQVVIDRFTNDDSYRFFVGSQRAGGVGLTLLGTQNVRVHNVFYYSNDFNFGARDQSEDRAHRIGLRNPVLYTDFVYKDSIEQYIAQKLQSKRDLATIVKNVGEIKELLLRKGPK